MRYVCLTFVELGGRLPRAAPRRESTDMRALTSPVTLTVPSRMSLADNVFRYADESPDFVACKKCCELAVG